MTPIKLDIFGDKKSHKLIKSNQFSSMKFVRPSNPTNRLSKYISYYETKKVNVLTLLQKFYFSELLSAALNILGWIFFFF